MAFHRVGLGFMAAGAVVLGALSVWPAADGIETLQRLQNGIIIACTALVVGALFVAAGGLAEHLQK